MNRSKPLPADKPDADKPDSAKLTPSPAPNPNSTRETVESIAVAVILAFLFRGFVAEAFVIPTGSMAPTLQGNHKDVVCDQCGHAYQAGASVENDDHSRPDIVVATTCPVCRFKMELDWNRNPNQRTFTGDRILVSKFSYELGDPERWDVIVFKFPNNAKQNYIKRLIGLPGETVRVNHGDILTRTQDDQPFEIARKPPAKVLAMLQVVDDTRHVPESMAKIDWHSKWQPWSPGEALREWRSCREDREGMTIAAGNDEQWFRYRHLIPDFNDWDAILDGSTKTMRPPGNNVGELITDFCAYNAFTTEDHLRMGVIHSGTHWVGDLAIECNVEITSAEGVLILDLVEAGQHFRAELDVAAGTVLVERRMPDGSVEELGNSESRATGIRGKGRHHCRLANVDDQICLWVDERLVFSAPYAASGDAQPAWNGDADPLDLAPAGIGGRNLQCHVTRAMVLRDVYYVATRNGLGPDDYVSQINTGHGTEYPNLGTVGEVFRDPETWKTTSIFKARQKVDFRLEKDQFFPMGDNSPQSLDGRLWGEPAYVERDLLTGKALMVYWPHYWNAPVPFMPNVGRMRLIH